MKDKLTYEEALKQMYDNIGCSYCTEDECKFRAKNTESQHCYQWYKKLEEAIEKAKRYDELVKEEK